MHKQTTLSEPKCSVFSNCKMHNKQTTGGLFVGATIHKELAEMNVAWSIHKRSFKVKKIKDQMAKKQKNVDYILK